MNFLERVKKVLLERNNNKLADLEKSISKINAQYSEQEELTQKLREELRTAYQEKSEVQSSMLGKSELDDLTTIYNFIVNYPVIQQILSKIKSTEMPAIDRNYVYLEDEADFINEGRASRSQLYGVVKDLNAEIAKIISGEVENVQNDQQRESEITETKPEPPKKTSFGSRLLRKLRWRKRRQERRKQRGKQRRPKNI